MSDITIHIEEKESDLVERLFFEYKASRDIIAFLMKDEDVNRELLQEYIDVSETRYTNLEMVKLELGDKYRPGNVCKKCNYWFDFVNEAIVYEVSE